MLFPLLISHLIVVLFFGQGCDFLVNGTEAFNHVFVGLLFCQSDVFVEEGELLPDFRNYSLLLGSYLCHDLLLELLTSYPTVNLFFLALQPTEKVVYFLHFSQRHRNCFEAMALVRTEQGTVRANLLFVSQTDNLQLLPVDRTQLPPVLHPRTSKGFCTSFRGLNGLTGLNDLPGCYFSVLDGFLQGDVFGEIFEVSLF